MKISWKVVHNSGIEHVGANNTEKSTVVIQINSQDILAVDFIWRSAPKASWILNWDNVTIEYKISSREYNGKYYTQATWFDISVDVSKDESYAKAGKPADDMDIPFK